jgi:hypothetical protein
VDDGNQKPSRSGANASKPKSFEANETTKTGARADADAAPSEAASRGSQYAGPVKGGSVTANKSTEGHSIGGDALERVDDVRESVELYSSDDDSNAITIIESTEIARNASDDSAIQETRQSETLPDGSLLESPAPAKVLPVDHDFRRGKGDLDQSRSLEHQVKARYSGIGSSAAGSKAARPEVSSEEDQQGSGAMGKRKPEVQEKAAAVDDRQRPGHSAHLEEAGYFLIGPAEITPPIQPSNIPEKATPQVPGTVHVRIGTVEVHADASPPTPRSRPRPSGFEGYEMIRSYMSWEH